MSTPDPCPICGVVGCTRSYPLMLARWAEGRDRDHWRRIHDGITVSESPTPYPTLWKQAASAATAAIGFVADGGRTVDRAVYDARLAICRDCEHYDAGPERCRKCGCYLAIKPWLVREHCPIDKW